MLVVLGASSGLALVLLAALPWAGVTLVFATVTVAWWLRAPGWMWAVMVLLVAMTFASLAGGLVSPDGG